MERPCNTESPTDAHRRLTSKMKGANIMSNNEIERKVRELRQLQSLIEEAQADAEAIKDSIKAFMGDSEELRTGEYKITWRAAKSVRIDTVALKRALPEVAQAFTIETTSRRFCVC